MQGHKDNIILIGMMGTGKSTVGAYLAAETGYQLVDMDHEIELKAGQSIPDIFASQGEAYFRELESSVLREVLQREHVIVATGGGCVLRDVNCKIMLDNGWVVALKADAASIISRVGEDPNRPLLAGGAAERITQLLKERKQAYDFAHCTIDTAGKSAAEVASDILIRYRV
ncbi:shikimate kinase [Paenibacillus sp. J22TS3]|uniref:shikimate kinase n=1 Tax=Paenibacillus sp. J22TS3 TaxID=2807192 RepID=UPI001B151D86|nr:shikimate kinase [Paenibacillus sp. J22TS3]GIP20367.1 shikimate kinase [Paenibacillus sp. J22TS3]